MKSTGSIYFSPWLSFGTTTASRTFFTIYGGPQRREILFLWGTKIALNKNWPRSKLQKNVYDFTAFRQKCCDLNLLASIYREVTYKKKVVDFTAGARF